ncbi:MAG: DUF4136 domain-containing protein [Gemmatimonadetes bacterium]|nr:DUF4136 domain-containing protein [Gemmatimonadota bacterium]
MKMYATNFRAAWSSAAVLVLAGCASLQVRTDYDQGAFLTPLRTYDWAGGEVDAGNNPAVNSPLLGKHIRGAVEGELDRRGYRQVTSGTPDFRIAYRVVAQERATAVGSYGYGGYYGYGRSHFGGHHGFRGYGGRFFSPYGYGYSGAGYGGAGRVREYLRGTLVLDITDARTGELIWRGWASKSLHLDPRPEKVRMYVDEAVAEMLADFPPKP